MPIVTSQMLLLQHCDVIENNSIVSNAAIPFVEKFKLLMNIDKWITHVQVKQFNTTPKSVVCTGAYVMKCGFASVKRQKSHCSVHRIHGARVFGR